jgi:cobalt-zinc-cadmium resistance protein CzcA
VNQSYFIRAEGKVKSLDDIENIVKKNGTPLCKNVADVRFGHANRLAPSLVTEKARRYLVSDDAKGANSKQVINDVKVRLKSKIITRRSLYKWIPRT